MIIKYHKINFSLFLAARVDLIESNDYNMRASSLLNWTKRWFIWQATINLRARIGTDFCKCEIRFAESEKWLLLHFAGREFNCRRELPGITCRVSLRHTNRQTDKRTDSPDRESEATRPPSNFILFSASNHANTAAQMNSTGNLFRPEKY